jgi:hypothetical protein
MNNNRKDAPKDTLPPDAWRRFLVTATVVLVAVGLPVLVELLSTPDPQSRSFHLEAFRYGTEPSILRVNRGDQLVLDFSTRDTGHSFFLQDYRIDAKIVPASGGELLEVRNPLDATAPPKYVENVRLEAGAPGWWGKLVSVSRFRCHVYCGPMHGFEQGDLIVRPNILLAGGLGLLVAIALIGYVRIRWQPVRVAKKHAPIDLNARFKIIDWLLRWRPLQYVATLPVMAGFVIIGLAGLFGTAVAGRNIAVMLTWAVWISMLAMFLIPLFGRLWCLVCPLPSLGEYLQRGATTHVHPGKTGRYGNRFLGLNRPWPKRLNGTWMRLSLFFGLGAFSASLAGQPRWTAITLLSLALLAIVLSLVFELRAFCRYVCPVGAFISLYSGLGRLMVRKRDQKVCQTCRDHACKLGNEKGWACPYGLCVAAIDTNADCGMCLECFKSCPNDNVSLAWRREAWVERFRSMGQAWQAIVFLVLAAIYSFTVHSPWPVMRDMVNVIDKSSWPQFGLYVLGIGTLTFALFPLVFWLATAWGARRSRGDKLTTAHAFKHTMPALIPLGLAFWSVFFVSTLLSNATYILLAFSDPFGWGWDLLGVAGMPWVQVWPSGIPWIQVAFTLTGLSFSLKKGYRCWCVVLNTTGVPLRAFAPTAGVLLTMAGAMIVYVAHY